MTTLEPALLDEALALVRELTTGRASLLDARDRLAPLRERWPQADLAVVRDEETSDGSVSFDVLLREPAGTVSVAYSPAPALPWPLRGRSGTPTTISPGWAPGRFGWGRP